MFLSLTLLLSNSTQNFLSGVDWGGFFPPVFNVDGIKPFLGGAVGRGRVVPVLVSPQSIPSPLPAAAPCPQSRPRAATRAGNPSPGRSRSCSALIWGFLNKSLKQLFPPDAVPISGWVKTANRIPDVDGPGRRKPFISRNGFISRSRSC